MDRKEFLKQSVIGLGTTIAIPSLATSCIKENMDLVDPNACAVSPREIAGPFPIKTPTNQVVTNIIGDRAGIPLLINITIQNTNDNCMPLSDVFVDIWQCDSKGNYSEYNSQLDGDFTSEHFLRGRQTSDAAGNVSFISIYPGWYPGRAPHIHIEVLNADGSSLLVSQIAMPEDISNTVYTTTEYNGAFDTANANDGSFRDSLARNIAEVMGNTTDGYTLTKILKVAG